MQVRWIIGKPQEWDANPNIFNPAAEAAGIGDPMKKVPETKEYIQLGDTDASSFPAYSSERKASDTSPSE